jgi:glyoxylase-like metal-dependent hydrolase (beta-lactamase superfamily II)
MKQLITTSGTKITMLAGGRSNVFMVSGRHINVLVDTGPAFMCKRLLKKFDKLSISSIDYLVLTHTHFDHAANAQRIKEKFGLKVIVHEKEVDYLLSGDSPVPAGTNAFTSWLSGTFGSWMESKVRYNSCKADIIVNDVFDLSDTGIKVRIIHTPGHSAGSLSLIVDNEIALAGDTLFGVYPGSCYPPFADHLPDLLKSWEKLLETDCRLFLPSHGRPRTRKMVEEGLVKRRQANRLISNF